MDSTKISKTVSASPASSSEARVQQSSIRSFFQPRSPTYTASPTSQPSTFSARSPFQGKTTSSPPAKSNNGAVQPKTLPPFPQQASIIPIDTSHIQPLRRINSLLLPVNYPDSFYHAILGPATPNFSRAILWTDSPSTPPKLIGGLVCRLDPSLTASSTPQAPEYVDGVYDLYVQSLVLLSPYRGMGLAAAALQAVVDAVTQQVRWKIDVVYAHVWTNNSEALEWYAARGFVKEGGVLEGYYKRLKPDSAWILKRRLGVGDHLAQSAEFTTAPISAVSHVPVISSIATETGPLGALSAQIRPAAALHSKSFQDRRPEKEWNDLPEEVLGTSLLKPPSASSTRDGSATSSRSSSRNGAGKKKKERSYPAAAFGT